jgi:arylsulfatase
LDAVLATLDLSLALHAYSLDDNPIGVETFYQKLRDAGYRVGSLGKADLRKAAFDWGPDGLHKVGGRSYFREWGFTDGFDSEGKMAVVNGVLKQRKKGQPLNPYARMLAERRDGSLEVYLSWYAAWQGQDFENHDYGYTVPYELADAAYNDNWVGANALALLEKEFPVQIPWFLQVNFPGPHDPADITNNMAGWYRGAFYAQPIRNNQLPPDVHQAIRRNYAAMVDNVDRWLGRFLEVLERRGELEKTLIVFSSDHGEMLGDHNGWEKSLPYQSSASVPLVVRGPGVKSGRVSESVTTTLDLAATFLDFAGLPIPSSMDSKSLRPVLSGLERGARSHITAALGGWRMVCDGRFKLVHGIDLPRAHGYGGGVPDEPGRTELTPADEQLFDLETDPSELDNLVHRRADIASRLYSLLPPMIPR